MKKYFKKRREHILSRSYYPRASTKGLMYLIGFMCALIWSMIIFYPLAGVEPAPAPVYLFGIVLIGLTVHMYFTYRKKDSRPETPHTWNPRKKAWRRTIGSFFALSIIICFLLVFVLILQEETANLENNIEVVVYVFVVIFVSIFGFFFLRNVIELINSFKQTTSEMKFQMQEPFHAGQIISAEFINERYWKNDLIVTIRNLKEYYSTSKDRKIPKNSSSYVVEVFYQEKISLSEKNGQSRHFQFQLPLEVNPTLYDYSSPVYWELEVSDPYRSFIHLFYIEVA